MARALIAHWPEYLIEAAGLGIFMLAACVFGTLLGHPASPLVHAVPGPLARRALMGVAMGLTAITLIYSPWGRRSGAHFNPATTLTFWRLGKVAPADALLYGAAQAVGGIAGVALAAALLGASLAAPNVNYVATLPGPAGPLGAFSAEVAITFVLMTVVLRVSNDARLARLTGLCAGVLVATYITVEAPLSGMSMNPARSLASALLAGAWPALWIYFVAPPLGMLLAAELFVRRRGLAAVLCAKLHHDTSHHCIFRCRYAAQATATGAGP
jgi:aquaporin Z